MEIDCLECSDNTLSASFNFLYDSDGGLHIGVESSSLFDDLFFRKCSLLEIKEELFNDLISFFLIRDFIVLEVPWYGHLDF